MILTICISPHYFHLSLHSVFLLCDLFFILYRRAKCSGGKCLYQISLVSPNVLTELTITVRRFRKLNKLHLTKLTKHVCSSLLGERAVKPAVHNGIGEDVSKIRKRAVYLTGMCVCVCVLENSSFLFCHSWVNFTTLRNGQEVLVSAKSQEWQYGQNPHRGSNAHEDSPKCAFPNSHNHAPSILRCTFEEKCHL